MVANATSYSGSGLRDWLVQRVTAIVLLAYVVFMVSYIVVHPESSFHTWQHLFSSLWVKVFTLIALLSLMIHAWIGVWTIFTDYVKPACVRIILESLVVIALLGYFIWGFFILWSI